MVKEYALWGTKNGEEEVIKVNGEEVQDTLLKAKKIKNILEKRGTFEKIRIQVIDMNPNNYDIKTSFIKTLK